MTDGGALIVAEEATDGTLVCAGSGPSIYEGVRQDLKYYFGEGLVAEMDAIGFRYR